MYQGFKRQSRDTLVMPFCLRCVQPEVKKPEVHMAKLWTGSPNHDRIKIKMRKNGAQILTYATPRMSNNQGKFTVGGWKE